MKSKNLAILQVRKAIDILACGVERWGSDDCACDHCEKLRRKARLDAITILSRALTQLGEDE